jgi:hypothetical protein
VPGALTRGHAAPGDKAPGDATAERGKRAERPAEPCQEPRPCDESGEAGIGDCCESWPEQKTNTHNTRVKKKENETHAKKTSARSESGAASSMIRDPDRWMLLLEL